MTPPIARVILTGRSAKKLTSTLVAQYSKATKALAREGRLQNIAADLKLKAASGVDYIQINFLSDKGRVIEKVAVPRNHGTETVGDYLKRTLELAKQKGDAISGMIKGKKYGEFTQAVANPVNAERLAALPQEAIQYQRRGWFSSLFHGGRRTYAVIKVPATPNNPAATRTFTKPADQSMQDFVDETTRRAHAFYQTPSRFTAQAVKEQAVAWTGTANESIALYKKIVKEIIDKPAESPRQIIERLCRPADGAARTTYQEQLQAQLLNYTGLSKNRAEAVQRLHANLIDDVLKPTVAASRRDIDSEIRRLGGAGNFQMGRDNKTLDQVKKDAWKQATDEYKSLFDKLQEFGDNAVTKLSKKRPAVRREPDLAHADRLRQRGRHADRHVDRHASDRSRSSGSEADIDSSVEEFSVHSEHELPHVRVERHHSPLRRKPLIEVLDDQSVHGSHASNRSYSSGSEVDSEASVLVDRGRSRRRRDSSPVGSGAEHSGDESVERVVPSHRRGSSLPPTLKQQADQFRKKKLVGKWRANAERSRQAREMQRKHAEDGLHASPVFRTSSPVVDRHATTTTTSALPVHGSSDVLHPPLRTFSFSSLDPQVSSRPLGSPTHGSGRGFGSLFPSSTTTGNHGLGRGTSSDGHAHVPPVFTAHPSTYSLFESTQSPTFRPLSSFNRARPVRHKTKTSKGQHGATIVDPRRTTGLGRGTGTLSSGVGGSDVVRPQKVDSSTLNF